MNGTYIPFIISFIFYIGSLITVYILDFKKVIDLNITVLSTLDYLITIFVIVLFYLTHKNRFIKINNFYKYNLEDKVSKVLFILIGFVVYIYYKAIKNMMLVIYSGYNREGLLNEIASGYMDMLLPSLFSVLFVISVKYKFSKVLKVILGLGVVGIMLTYLSRSNLLNIILLFFGLFFFSREYIKFNILYKIFITLIVIIFLASYITVLQGREDNVYSAFSKIFTTLFRYKSYSFYLSEIAIDISSGAEKLPFPFFGFLSEKLLSYIVVIDNPISIYNSDFVSKFHFLGSSYRANVLYPWWSWFYGCFGFLGLIIKAIYVYFLLRVMLYFKLNLTLFFFLYVLLFSSVVRHPFLNAIGFYSILSLVLFDLYLKLKIRVTI